MDLGICLSMTSSVWVEIFIDGENSFNFLKTAAMAHYMSLFYLIYKYWSHKYWLKLGNENKKICKHVKLENLSKQQQQKPILRTRQMRE